MRIACEVVFMKMTAGPRPQQKASKGQKSFIVMEKTRKTPASLYQISFPLVGDKEGNKFLLDKPPHMVTQFIQQGKLTLTFPKQPAVTVLISKASPEDLKSVVESIRKIAKGEDVDLSKVKVKTSDFKPIQINVKDLATYSKQRNDFSEFLRVLTFDPVMLRIPDKKWATCSNLTKLVLSGNPFMTNCKDFEVLSRLVNLQALLMNGCALGDAPWPVVHKMFKILPKSLNWLDIGENQLEFFPPIFHLSHLRDLCISHNRIRYIPSRICQLNSLRTLNLCSNRIQHLPNDLRLKQMDKLEISENDGLTVPRADQAQGGLKQLLTKIDAQEYSHPGGVDTLKTIAANAVHRDPKLSRLMHHFLPLCLRFHVDDLMYEEPSVSSLEVCSGCKLLRHIRFVQPDISSSRHMRASVDLVDRYIKFSINVCMDCWNRVAFADTLPIDTDYFKYSI